MGGFQKGTYFVKLTFSALANQPSTKNNSLSFYRLSAIYDYHTRGNSMQPSLPLRDRQNGLANKKMNASLNPERTTIGHLWTMCRRSAGWGFHKQYLLSNSAFRSTTRSRRPRPKSYQDTRQKRLLLHFDGEWFLHATSRSRTRTPASVSWQWCLLSGVPPRRSREDFSRELIWAEDFAGGVEAGRQGGAATGGPNPWR